MMEREELGIDQRDQSEIPQLLIWMHWIEFAKQEILMTELVFD